MSYKKILTMQDISCVGQCSLTVALPIISACGLETCILPSAVLSTHTAGFSGFTFRDLSEDIPNILAHWEKENILFDMAYTGYLGSIQQIDFVKKIFQTALTPKGVSVMDPAMADNGKLYPLFDEQYAKAMAGLVQYSNIIIPNITEACYLTGIEYRENYDENYIAEIIRGLKGIGARKIVLTGVSYDKETTGVVACDENGNLDYYRHKLLPKGCHGTGDIFASAFVGALGRDKTLGEAIRIAADFTVLSIEKTHEDKDNNHWYGAEFEKALPYLVEKVNK